MSYKVSAIVSTYASARFIEQRIENLVQSTLYKRGKLEIIVIDSCSPENEQELLKPFLETYDHIRYLRTPERETLYKAWNRGLEMMNGEYFINANSDDRFSERGLEEMADELDADYNIDACYGDWLITRSANDTFDSDTPKSLAQYPDYFPPLFFYFQITSHAAMIRKSAFDEVGLFTPEYKVYGDRDFFLRFALAGLKALHIGRTVGLYFEDSSSLGNRNTDSRTNEANHVSDKYFQARELAILYGFSPNQSPDYNTLIEWLSTYARAEYRVGGKGQVFLERCEELHAYLNEKRHRTPSLFNNLGCNSITEGNLSSAVSMFEYALKLATKKNYMEPTNIAENLRSAKKGFTNDDRYYWAKKPKEEFASHYSLAKQKERREIRSQKKREEELAKYISVIGSKIKRGGIGEISGFSTKRYKRISETDKELVNLLLTKKINKSSAIEFGIPDSEHVTSLNLLDKYAKKLNTHGVYDIAAEIYESLFNEGAITAENIERYVSLAKHLDWIPRAIDKLRSMEKNHPERGEIALALQLLLGEQAAKSYGGPIPDRLAKPENPLVSCIVSTYNAEQFLEGRLINLLSQTIADQIEIIIIDSGSQQDEKAIVNQFASRFENIIYRRTQRETLYKAWNRGIRLARGKFVTNSNTDDRLRLDALEILSHTLRENEDLDLVYSNCFIATNPEAYFSPEGIVGRYDYFNYHPAFLRIGLCNIGPMPMWRRSIHDTHGYFAAEMKTSGDLEFWNRIAGRNNMTKVNRVLGSYLKRADSIEHANRAQQIKENKEIYNTYSSYL